MAIIILDAKSSVVKKLAKEFDCNVRTVQYALSFGRNSALSNEIRAKAKKMGAVEVTMYPSEGWKTIHDEEGFIRQYFPNGAIIIINKHNSDAELEFNGESVESVHNLTIGGWSELINRAKELK